MEFSPKSGDSCIVLKEPYVTDVMSGAKTMELRINAIRRRHLWMASSTSHEVVARLEFGDFVELTEETYVQLRDQHRCGAPRMPYSPRTVGTVICGVERLAAPVPYRTKPGAVGFITFEPPLSEEEEMKAKEERRAKLAARRKPKRELIDADRERALAPKRWARDILERGSELC